MKIFLVATEASADFLAARLMKAIKALKNDEEIQFFGMGGELMNQEGLHSFAHMDELNVMGILEVVPKIKKALAIMKVIVDQAVCHQPDIIITIDAPSFCIPLAKKLRQRLGKMIKLVHYVSPTVWAWKQGRAKIMAQVFDHLLTLFEFENNYFTPLGLTTTFVGHAMIERPIPTDQQRRSWKKMNRIAANQRLIAVLPGSRPQEIKKHLEIFIQSINLLEHKNIVAIIPTFLSLKPEVERLCQQFLQVDYKIVTQNQWKEIALSCCNSAIAASGTITLELARLGIPMVVAYRTNWLSYFIAKKMVRIPFFSLVNILSQCSIVVELLQHACTASNIAGALEPFLTSTTKKNGITTQLQHLITLITPLHDSPSMVAARVVVNEIEKDIKT